MKRRTSASRSVRNGREVEGVQGEGERDLSAGDFKFLKRAFLRARRFADLALLAPVKDYPARHTSTMLAFEACAEAVRTAVEHAARCPTSSS